MSLSERTKTVIRRAIQEAENNHLGLMDNVVHQLRFQHKYTYAEIVQAFKEQGLHPEDFESYMYLLDEKYD